MSFSDSSIDKALSESNIQVVQVESSQDPVVSNDGREPTEDELATLPRVSGKIPLRCWLVSLVGLTERVAFYGVTTTFQNYMQYLPTHNPAGMLDLQSNVATSISFSFQFWCYLSPTFGAWISDTYWGKFKTIMVAAVTYAIGLAILFATSLPVIHSRTTQMVGFFVAIIVIGSSSGAINANCSPFMGDQVDRHRPYIKVLKNGDKVIVDSAITLQRSISLFYFMNNVGAFSCIATTFMEFRIGFWAAYLLPLCFLSLLFTVIFLCKKKYVKKPISDKIISKCFRVIFIACKNKFNFDLARPSANPNANFPWTDLFVDEVRRSLYACKVFLLFPVFWICYNQTSNNLVTQAGQMELYGLPNDALTGFNALTCIIIIPIYEKILFPFIRRFTPFRAITRITCGFFITSIAMVYAAVLQSYILKTQACVSNPSSCPASFHTSRLHIATEVPTYILLGIAEVLLVATGIEYAYTKAPSSMKSFIMALYLLTDAVGSLIGISLGPVSVPLKVIWTFTGLSVCLVLCGIIFWFCFKHYNYQEEALGNLDFAAKEQEMKEQETKEEKQSGKAV